MWQALEADLRGTFDVIDEEIAVGDSRFAMLHPRSADDLICEADFDLDERLPYWAEVWPSARVLAGRIAREEGRGRRLLELGCGSGLVAAMAARSGFEVTATDYYAEALDFTRLNSLRNGLPEPAVRLVDWRHPPEDLGLFDLVVAADVLYERPYSALVAQAFRRWLAPGGRGILTDPRRRNAVGFPDECRSAELRIESAIQIRWEETKTPVTIDLFEISASGG